MTIENRTIRVYGRTWVFPDLTYGSLHRFVVHGIEPGGFLTAVLSNDLQGACGNADEENLDALPGIVAFIYNRVPSSSQGSLDRVHEWMNMSDEDRDFIMARTEHNVPDHCVACEAKEAAECLTK